MRLSQLEPRLLGDQSGNRGRGFRPKSPEPHVAVCLRGGRGRNTGPRQRVARAENRQRLLGLQELGEARALSAVRHRGIRVRESRVLLAARDLRFRADRPRLRPIAHDQLHDFALGSVLGQRQRWHDYQAESSDPGTDLGSGRHKTVLDYSN